MIGNKKIFYWDSNVYLAWLLDEEVHKDFLPHINSILAANFRRENVIFTSTLTLTEVLSSRITSEQEKRFRKGFNQYDHVLIEVTEPIASKARAYRDFYDQNPVDGRKLLVPDAIHLATASTFKADELHTFDNGRKPGIEDHLRVRTISMLSLNGSVAGDPLRICKPMHHKTVTSQDPPMITGELFKS